MTVCSFISLIAQSEYGIFICHDISSLLSPPHKKKTEKEEDDEESILYPSLQLRLKGITDSLSVVLYIRLSSRFQKSIGLVQF